MLGTVPERHYYALSTVDERVADKIIHQSAFGALAGGWRCPLAALTRGAEPSA